MITLSGSLCGRLSLHALEIGRSPHFPLIIKDAEVASVYDERMNLLGQVRAVGRLLPDGVLEMPDGLFAIMLQGDATPNMLMSASAEALEGDFLPTTQARVALKRIVSRWQVQGGSEGRCSLFYDEKFVCHVQSNAPVNHKHGSIFVIGDGSELILIIRGVHFCFQCPSPAVSVCKGPTWLGEESFVVVCEGHVGILSHSYGVHFVRKKTKGAIWSEFYRSLIFIEDDGTLSLLPLCIYGPAFTFVSAPSQMIISDGLMIQVGREYARLGMVKGVVGNHAGNAFVVFGPCGFCFCNVRARIWKMFGDPSQERSFSVEAACWLANDTVAIASNDSFVRVFRLEKDLDLREALASAKLPSIRKLLSVNDVLLALDAQGDLFVLDKKTLSILSNAHVDLIDDFWMEEVNEAQVLLILKEGNLFELAFSLLFSSSGGEARLFVKLDEPILKFVRIPDPAVHSLTWTLCVLANSRMKLVGLDHEIAIDLDMDDDGFAFTSVDLYSIKLAGLQAEKSIWLLPHVLRAFIVGNWAGEASLLLKYWADDPRLGVCLEHVLAQLVLSSVSLVERFHLLVGEFVGWSVYQRTLVKVARTLELKDALQLFEQTIPLQELLNDALKEGNVELGLMALRLELAIGADRAWLRQFVHLLNSRDKMSELVQALEFIERACPESMPCLEDVLRNCARELYQKRQYVDLLKLVPKFASFILDEQPRLEFPIEKRMALIYSQLQLNPLKVKLYDIKSHAPESQKIIREMKRLGIEDEDWNNLLL